MLGQLPGVLQVLSLESEIEDVRYVIFFVIHAKGFRCSGSALEVGGLTSLLKY
jgi:hypothetical protein